MGGTLGKTPALVVLGLTVIVTAAVHRGFDSELCPDKSGRTLPFNLPALGRHQPLYVAFRLCRDLCF